MPVYDPAWLDRQYNNRARIPEHPQIFERWSLASALAREQLDCHLDLAYGGAPAETLDVYPAQRAGAPILVFIHGGWWRSLDKREHAFLAPVFVESGAMVVMPNYTLCPETTVQRIALQMASALAWTWHHAAEYGGDPRRIVVAGHSAGGHLATMLLNCEWRQIDEALPPQLVPAALSISGLYDLEPVAQAPFLKADLRLTPEDVERLSPATQPRPRGTLVTVAGALESEEFLRQNRLIREAWGRDTVPVCETVPGANHLNILHELADPQARLHALALALLGLV